VQEHVPIKLGAMGGPKSMQLAGEIADGLHTACAYSAEALRYAVHHFKVGAERAGRAADRLDIGDSMLGAIAPDPDVARRAGRILAAFYIPSMPPTLLERHGIDPDEVAPVNEAFAAGDIERALEPCAPLLHRPLHTQSVGRPRRGRPARPRRTGTTLRRTRPSPAPLKHP
jgi:5,10-methylenetetrahydromethanopterin reductase